MSCCPNKIVLDDIESLCVSGRLTSTIRPISRRYGIGSVTPACGDEMVDQLVRFCHTEPRLPLRRRAFCVGGGPVGVDTRYDARRVIAHLESLRAHNETADMAFYAWRDLSHAGGTLYQGGDGRNPVSVAALAEASDDEVVARVAALPDISIYDEDTRLAQPDEVWTFGRGDGFEKALLVANVARSRGAGPLCLTLVTDEAVLTDEVGAEWCRFATCKRPAETCWQL